MLKWYGVILKGFRLTIRQWNRIMEEEDIWREGEPPNEANILSYLKSKMM